MVTLPDVVVERKSTRGEAALHVVVSKTSSTQARHRRGEKTLGGDARRLSSALLTRFLQRHQRARPRPRKPRRSVTKEEKVGGGGGGVGERVVADPRHRDRVKGEEKVGGGGGWSRGVIV